jgi:uncharacterized membrane protein
VGDVLHATTPRDPFWYDLSFTCIGIGLIFAVIAAVFGAVDYLAVPMSRKVFQLATWHGATTARALTAATPRADRADRSGKRVAWSIPGATNAPLSPAASSRTLRER